MAGTAVFNIDESNDGKFIALTWLCTADGSGNVSSPTITQPGTSSVYKYNTPFTGIIGQVRIKPGTSSVEPTDLYDVQLNPQSDSTIDFLGGIGQNCSQTNTKFDMPLTSGNGTSVAVFKDILLPYASGVGASKQFTMTVYLYIF